MYPEGDPSEYALPIFVEEPKNQYTARGSPANLVCKVAHAVKVYFVCNDEVMTSSSEEDMIDPVMSIRYTKITLEVKRSDAMDVLGKYICKCHATSAQGEVSSREASVNVACKFKAVVVVVVLDAVVLVFVLDVVVVVVITGLVYLEFVLRFN